ncbi:MAG: hypothetical protein JW889_14220 [Verrucomicrobia bacterium]|nr:hypothetical protein [Verrucomicrobiota bacterium]
MRGLTAILIICAVLAAPTPAAEPGGAGTGDVETYTPDAAPLVVIENVFPGEIDAKTFVLVEGALFVPDRIRFHDPGRTYDIEVVNTDEFDGIEAVAEIRLPDTLDLTKVRSGAQPGVEIVRFEQRMWRQGLRLVVRDYRKPGAVVVRYTAFRVTFDSAGDLYRATVTLYAAQTTLKQHIDAVTTRVGDTVDRLEKVNQSVQKAARESKESNDKIERQLTAVEVKLKSLESSIEAVDRVVQSIDRRVGTLEHRQ